LVGVQRAGEQGVDQSADIGGSVDVVQVQVPVAVRVTELPVQAVLVAIGRVLRGQVVAAGDVDFVSVQSQPVHAGDGHGVDRQLVDPIGQRRDAEAASA
jgi:hypothetical protein